MNKKEFKAKIILATYSIVLFVFLINYQWVGNIVRILGHIFLPFIIGFIMAFILNVLVKILEEKVFLKVKVGKRGISIITSLLLVFGFIAFILLILIPQFRNAGEIFVNNIPEYQENIYEIGKKIGLSTEDLRFFDLETNEFKKQITELITDNSEFIITISMGLANSVVSVFTDCFVGLIFAIYVLLDKETLKKQADKLLKKVCRKDVYEKVIEIGQLSSITFANFVKVQVLEAFILGFLCFLGMLLLKLPYAATISVLVGFTALIPIFGAFFGCIIGTFLIFMVSPVKALIFIVFFLILQQFENNLIYPHVVGGKIGLPSIWVLVAVIIGGSVGGIFGMLLGVPVLSIIYSLMKQYVSPKKIVKSESKTSLKKEITP